MTREQAKTKLVSFGIAEPTEEQITSLLNSVMDETKSERDKADKFKTDAEKALELQKQIDEFQNKGLSEVEQMKKQLEAIATENECLKKQNIASEVKAILNSSGLTETEYGAFLDGFVAGDIETSKQRANAFVETISNREKAINTKVREELMDETKGLGGKGGQGGEEKSEAVKMAEQMATNSSGSLKTAQASLDYYSGGK